MNKYAALRVISALYLYGGVTVFVFAAVLGVMGVVINQNYPNSDNIIGPVFIAMFGGLSMMAFGQLINLFMAIEESTRATADALNRLLRNQGNRQKNNEDEEVPMMPIRKR